MRYPLRCEQHADVIKQALRDADVDLNGTVKLDNGQTRPRVCFATFGNELGLNDYRYCRNVVLAGLLELDDNVIVSKAHGSISNIESDVTFADVKTYAISEKAHLAFQAMNRSAMRAARDGKAGRAKVWMRTATDGVCEKLKPVMPDAHWQTWDEVRPHPEGKPGGGLIAAGADRIVEVLTRQPERVKSVTFAELRKDPDLATLNRHTFNAARRQAEVVALFSGWEIPQGKRRFSRAIKRNLS